MSQSTQRVGQYNFLKKLGAGRMAEVSLGRIEGAEGFQKPVAIKKILAELAGDLQFVQSLIAEAKVGGQLHHRNIVEVYDLIRYGSDYCIIMEYVDGVDLSRILRSAKRYRVRIPPAAALYIASQVCDGLDYAHSARGFNGEPLNIIHRDLKPSNVLISIKGGVKISDFGIARVMEQATERLADMKVSKSSFLYQSPEQSSGSVRLTSASDIFSVGVILFEMLTLEPLFSGKNAIEAFQGMPEGELQKRLSLAQRQLPGSERVLTTALNPNPSERYRSAGMMAEDLRRLLVYMKVDDPRERLVIFFARLVRFVQEQGKRPSESSGNGPEDWEAETRVDPSANSGEGAAGTSGTGDGDRGIGRDSNSSGYDESNRDASGIPEPDGGGFAGMKPAVDRQGGDERSWNGEGHGGDGVYGASEEAPPQDHSGTAPLPSGYGQDASSDPSWNGTEGTPASDAYPGRDDALGALPPPTEETRVGTYETVQPPYETPQTNNLAASAPAMAEADGLDSTRIIPAADTGGPPPPVAGYGATVPLVQSPGVPGAYDATQDLDSTRALPDREGDYAQDAPRTTRRARLPLMAAGLVGMLALGGGGVALYDHFVVSEGAVAGGGLPAGHVTCPTCGRDVACAPYCPYCGGELECEDDSVAPADAFDVICAYCGSPNERGSKFCGNCGKPLPSESTAGQQSGAATEAAATQN